MSEKLIQIKDKILGVWNKYTNKQKTIIVCVVAGIFFSLVLLTYFVSKPSYVLLRNVDSTKTASEIATTLDSKGILYQTKTSADQTVTAIYVEKKSIDEANLVVGSSGVLSEGMSWEDALNNDMSTTTEEKKLKSSLALQTSLATTLKEFQGINDAVVSIDVPTDDSTIFSEKKETTVGVVLTLKDNYTPSTDASKSMAAYLANAVGNSTTDKIMITDTKGNLLFSGGNGQGLGGSVNNSQEYTTKLKNQIDENVKVLLQKFGYNDVQIGTSNIKFNMDKVTDLVKQYTVTDGQEQGYLSSTYNYKSTGSSGGSTGTPGTDSNADTTDTMTQDTNTSTDNVTTVDKANYLPNELVRNIEYEVGAVKAAESSLSLVLTQYKIIKEDTLKSQGALSGITFQDYIDQNEATLTVPLTVDQNVYALVSNTTGINQKNITIYARQKPIFQASESSGFSLSNYLMIALAVLIVALLGFVVFKGTSPVEITELEPELSVEDLLATTKEGQSLEDIEFSEKSEIRVMIEKFVDDNPDAVAQLLRNWLNEEWG